MEDLQDPYSVFPWALTDFFLFLFLFFLVLQVLPSLQTFVPKS